MNWLRSVMTGTVVAFAAPLALAGAPYTPVPVGGGVFVPGPGIMAPDEVFGKEYSNDRDETFDGFLDPEQVIAWDGIGGTADGVDYSLSRPVDLPREQQVDAIANVNDYLFADLLKDRAHLIFTHDDTVALTTPAGGAAFAPVVPLVGPVTLSNGNTIGGASEVSIEESGVFNGPSIQHLWASAPTVNSAPLPNDVDGLEVWGPEPAVTGDANKYSLEDDVFAGAGISVWSYTAAGTSVPYVPHAIIVTAVESLLGAPGAAMNRLDQEGRNAINLDALMVMDGDGVPEQFGGIGDAIVFSINQMIDGVGGYYATGSEIFVLEAVAGAGLTASFLYHGDHFWDKAYALADLRVAGPDDTSFVIDINGIEAIGESVVPEPTSLALLTLTGLAVVARRRRA